MREEDSWQRCKPNEGHLGLASLEKHFDVQIITQNIDDLHERAGSTKILHLHGELTKARSTVDPSLIYDIGYKDINRVTNVKKEVSSVLILSGLVRKCQ